MRAAAWSPMRWARSARAHREAARAMIRIIIFLVLIGVISLGIAWLADRPGEVTIQWLGFQIQTSIMVAVFAIAMGTALLLFLWTVLRAIINAPDLFALFLRNRRGAKGYQAISRGLIA